MNIVSGLAHDILRLRGQSIETCTIDQLQSAYDRAEKIAESMVRVAQRVARRAEREAA